VLCVRYQHQAERSLAELESEFTQHKHRLTELRQEEELSIARFLTQEQGDEQANEVLAAVQSECHVLEEKTRCLELEEKGLKHEITDLEAQREMMARAASVAIAQAKETKDSLKVRADASVN